MSKRQTHFQVGKREKERKRKRERERERELPVGTEVKSRLEAYRDKKAGRQVGRQVVIVPIQEAVLYRRRQF